MQVQQPQQEPLYAVCNKNFQGNKIYQTHGPQSIPNRPLVAPRPPVVPPVQRPPVVLREPTPGNLKNLLKYPIRKV